MSTSLARVPLTLAAAFAFHVSMSPPSTSATDKVTSSDRRAVCATARFVCAVLTKGLFWASALTDTFVVLAPHVSALGSISIPPRSTFLAWINHPTILGQSLNLSLPTSLAFSRPPLPLVTLAGTALALTGAYLRYAAYHSLGQFYACPNRGTGSCAPCGGRAHAHALITTGPYAIVRHPGYAGLMLCTTGLVMLQVDALKASGVATTVRMRTVAVVCAILATVGALRRIRQEERSLRARFKAEWEAWAKNVPYRLVPGVY